MSQIKIAAIMRSEESSPNHVGNDSAIFNLVVEQLRKRGCDVTVYSDNDFANGAEVPERIIVDMCRESASIRRLQQMEDEGRIVINSGYGIENCTRERMTRILIGERIPYPDSLIVNTDEVVKERMKTAGMSRVWIKRGESHTMHREDISYVRHPDEAQEVLQEYFLRGIKRAVINRHLEGDLVKFYGIEGSQFFYWFYPYDLGHSKFGHESINGHSHGYDFDINVLRSMCTRAAEALGVRIYGGDCIVASDGSIKIIDFNDWPSFARCRNEAGPQIARTILNIIKSERQNH